MTRLFTLGGLALLTLAALPVPSQAAEKAKAPLACRDSGRQGRSADRYDSRRSDRGGRYGDRYDRRSNDRYSDRSNRRSDDRYDSRSGDRYDERYDSRYDDRYSDRSQDRYDPRYDDTGDYYDDRYDSRGRRTSDSRSRSGGTITDVLGGILSGNQGGGLGNLPWDQVLGRGRLAPSGLKGVQAKKVAPKR